MRSQGDRIIWTFGEKAKTFIFNPDGVFGIHRLAFLQNHREVIAAFVVAGNGIGYHGGPVLHTINVYYIWYGNWAGLDPTGPAILTDFASNDGGSPYFAINTTYGDTTGNVPNAVTFAGQTTVAGNSTSLSDNDVANIVATALGQFGGAPDTNGVYFVLTAPGINETSGFLTQYCGWHTNGTFTNGVTHWDIKYAFVGNAAGPYGIGYRAV